MLSSSIPPNTFEKIMNMFHLKSVTYLEALEIAHMGLFIFAERETGYNCWSLQSEESSILKACTNAYYLEYR